MTGDVRPSYDELAALVVAQAATIVQLRGEVERLTAQVEQLQRQLKTNSRNSSKPPSQDVFAKPAPKSLRRKTGQGKGKQPGASGASLKLVDAPDVVVDHVPSACSGCGSGLRRRPNVGVVRRQVHDLPEMTPVVTEHRLHQRRCACGVLTTAGAPAEATAPACYGPNITALAAYLLTYQHLPLARAAQLLADVVGMAVSTGWIAGVLTRVAPTLEPFVEATRAEVRAASLAHFDETGVRVLGKNQWLHSASTLWLTVYFLHGKRGRDAIDAFGILDGFTGIAVHDGWHSYRTYDVTHALCNAHHQRELQAAAETHPAQQWHTALSEVLDELNAAAHAAREFHLDTIPDEVLTPLTRRYDGHIADGLRLHPRNHTGHPKGGRPRQSTSRALLERLRKYRDDVLRFAFDLTVPFTNNQAERDIRMTKTQLKISGGWRTTTGATTWLTVRSYISTVRKNGINTLTALRDALTGNPWLPTHPATT
ncbi:IS66 family transposase [Amycolatopsis sp. NPDC059657]|uniref:IS66 family transposase n=1 Tax=Amycolatopsis sp. NPDC059657 TaxID=3346899 RepID=UPI00366BF2BF